MKYLLKWKRKKLIDILFANNERFLSELVGLKAEIVTEWITGEVILKRFNQSQYIWKVFWTIVTAVYDNLSKLILISFINVIYYIK